MQQKPTDFEKRNELRECNHQEEHVSEELELVVEDSRHK